MQIPYYIRECCFVNDIRVIAINEDIQHKFVWLRTFH